MVNKVKYHDGVIKTITSFYGKKGADEYWPEQFDGGEATEEEVRRAFFSLVCAGYLIEVMELECPLGHRVMKEPTSHLRDIIKECPNHTFRCVSCDKGFVLKEMVALRSFKMTDDWKELLDEEK